MPAAPSAAMPGPQAALGSALDCANDPDDYSLVNGQCVRSSTALGRVKQAPLTSPSPPTADQLMDWAEANYPQLFPVQGKQTGFLSPYTYRYYPLTDNYIGVTTATSAMDVYVYGNVSNWQIARVGAVQDFSCQVLPANCAPDAATQALYVDQLIAAGVKIPLTLGEQRAFQIKDAAGSTISVIGPRSSTGALTSVSKIEVAKTTETHSQTFIGATEQYFELGGVHLHLKKQSDGTWLGIFKDVASGAEYQQVWQAPPTAAAAANRVAVPKAGATRQANSAELGVKVTVQTKSCGQKQDFTRNVRLAVKNGAGLPLSTTFTTTRVGDGKVEGIIPNPALQAQKNLQYVKGVIASVKPLIDVACATLLTTPAADAMCSYLSVAAMSTVVGAPLAGQFYLACEAAVVVARAACVVQTLFPPWTLEYLDHTVTNELPTLDSVLVAAAEHFLLDGSVTPEYEGQILVSQGTEIDLTPATTAVSAQIDLTGSYCDQDYTTKTTVRSFYIPPPIQDSCNNGVCAATLFCGPGDTPWVVGQVENGVDRWKLRSTGVAEVTDLPSGTFNADTGTISITDSWGPDRIQEVFFSSGEEVIAGARGVDGVIRATVTEKLITTWTRDSRRAECTAVYDYEARPTFRP